MLYNVVRRKDDLVANCLSTSSLNISFRRPIVGTKLLAWNELLLKISNFQLDVHKDTFRWHLNKSGLYSVPSFYAALVGNVQAPIRSWFWSIKIPLKVKIFMWYLKREIILTKDNLFKRNWRGSTKCCFCIKEETIQHLFFIAPLRGWHGGL